MTIYIVILTWNNSEDFTRCLQALATCTFVQARLVVVDNGSSEQEREHIITDLMNMPERRVEMAHLLFNETNLGIPVAHNQALSWIAETEPEPYGVVLLSADTVVSEGWLGKILAYSGFRQDVGIIGGGKSFNSHPTPVYYSPNGRWYVHDLQYRHKSGFMEGESVDFCCAYLRPEIVARGLCFDEGYEIYDGYDQDMTFRVRSWGYKTAAIDAGVSHYGSAVMKRRGYKWAGGGRHEWDLLRQRNVERFAKIWEPFLAPYRGSIEAEIEHMAAMNAKLVAEAGDRKDIPGV